MPKTMIQNFYDWKPPPSDCLKLNVDGAVFGEIHRAGVRLVLRDGKCEIIMTAMLQEKIELATMLDSLVNEIRKLQMLYDDYQQPPYLNSASTLQLCVGHHCLIFHIQHARIIPLALRRFLSYPKNTFFSVFDHKDPRKLLDSEYHLSVSNLVDVRDEVKFLGWSGDLTVEQLADCLLGFKEVNIPHEIGISTNWDDVSLTKEQVQYASVDAFLSFSMGMALSARGWRHWAKGYKGHK
ncbi:hypothetical protein CIPAW_15G108300 [Carya illinoinensis]|uniref:3'-5' exonuclease domain-containing protein n=1 Tax=Carya illinoinensis TaxID=32201 RepID=A0A8T1NA50_CARIL|nr:hypothetical protein CIPAW_15G108300 [Carya illinoinensis]